MGKHLAHRRAVMAGTLKQKARRIQARQRDSENEAPIHDDPNDLRYALER